jgi:DNA (cytosine-5)-methyltransferase 1
MTAHSDAMNYYNEFDLKAAAWLQELMKEGHIPPGEIDTRSITDVKPHEIRGFTQQHFFAGIGGWSLALRLANWPDDRPVRTGSCPCQPFSNLGKQLAEKDERHLWPIFRNLIAFGEPAIAFGEQVATPLGRSWLSDLRADLEGLGYEVGAANLCSASVGATNIRQRLYWVANPTSQRRRGRRQVETRQSQESRGSGTSLRFEQGPDHRGSESSLRVSDVLSPSYAIPGRVALLRGYGNSINPLLAAEFIQAFEEVRETR